MNIRFAVAGARRAAVTLWLAACTVPALAVTYDFRIDTPALALQGGGFSFEFISNSGNADNHLTVGQFSSSATLTTSSVTGSVSGSLIPGPLTFTGASFFNEFLQRVASFGTYSQFRVDLAAVAAPGPVPDSFALYVLNSVGVPLATSDPSGTNALLLLTLAAEPALQIYAATDFSATLVPEPAAWALLTMGGAAVCALARARRRAAREVHTRSPAT